MFQTILIPKFSGRLNYTNHEMDGVFPRTMRQSHLICRSYATRDEINCGGKYDLGFTVRWSKNWYQLVFSGEEKFIKLVYADIRPKIKSTSYTHGSIYITFPESDKELTEWFQNRYYLSIGETLSELYRNNKSSSEIEIPEYNEEIDHVIQLKHEWMDIDQDE